MLYLSFLYRFFSVDRELNQRFKRDSSFSSIYKRKVLIELLHTPEINLQSRSETTLVVLEGDTNEGRVKRFFIILTKGTYNSIRSIVI